MPTPKSTLGEALAPAAASAVADTGITDLLGGPAAEVSPGPAPSALDVLDLLGGDHQASKVLAMKNKTW